MNPLLQNEFPSLSNGETPDFSILVFCHSPGNHGERFFKQALSPRSINYS